MEKLDWERQIEWESSFGLTNEHYLLGQAGREITKKDIKSLEFAIELIKKEIERQTQITK